MSYRVITKRLGGGGGGRRKKKGERCYSTQKCGGSGLRLGIVSIKSEKGYHIIEFAR